MAPAPVRTVLPYLEDTARAYSAIFFLDSPAAGAVLLVSTFVYPNVGAAGLLGALVGLVAARGFGFPESRTSIYLLNSLLVGLSLGAFYRLDARLAVFIAIGAVSAVVVSAALADLFWRRERLPVLVIPFLLVATVTATVARQFIDPELFLPAPAVTVTWLPGWLNELLSLLGATFFTAHPLSGFVVLSVMLWRSRYLALLAVMAVAVGQGTLSLLALNHQPLLVGWAGFNLVLTAIAVGAIYTVPGLASFATAMLAVVLASILLVACQDLLFVHGLPVIALPYVLTTLVFLLALRTRLSVAPPWLATHSGMPEQNYERARLARVRNGAVDSVPLLLPVLGRWRIYQGFDGEHTHRPPWQHALDLYITEDGQSFRKSGTDLADFHCFGLPVLSPVYGQVVRTRDHLPDNPPGEVDVNNNWGNFVLIRLESGLHVLLAHLRQNSLRVGEGDRVQPGHPLAACGNSGRSPQPHLHLQVQREAGLGSPTVPFHLCSLLRHDGEGESEYLVTLRPRRGETVEPAIVDQRFAHPLHLPVGRLLTYRVRGPSGEAERERTLQVRLSLLGQFRLTSESGASAAFEEANGVLAFYDRQGPEDHFLDIWLLACGLTPLSESARRWHDAPSSRLLPLSRTRRLLADIYYPLGGGLDSHYRRFFSARTGRWQQEGRHVLKIGNQAWTADTECQLDPELGFCSINLVLGARRWEARLTDLGLAGDEGVPGWDLARHGEKEPTEGMT